jgi:hypothetical protein
MRTRDSGAHPWVGALVLALLLLGLVAREERRPVRAPLPRSPGVPLLEAGDPAKDPPLERFSRRYAGQDLTVEVIYASPLLPAEEAANPVFRVIAIRPAPLADAFPADLGRLAQLRTSDGRVIEGLLWQEELHGDGRLLGYLFCPPEAAQALLTRQTRWVELTLTGLTPQPLCFRWPAARRMVGERPTNLVE